MAPWNKSVELAKGLVKATKDLDFNLKASKMYSQEIRTQSKDLAKLKSEKFWKDSPLGRLGEEGLEEGWKIKSELSGLEDSIKQTQSEIKRLKSLRKPHSKEIRKGLILPGAGVAGTMVASNVITKKYHPAEKTAEWTKGDTGTLLVGNVGGPMAVVGKKAKEEGWAAPASIALGALVGAGMGFGLGKATTGLYKQFAKTFRSRELYEASKAMDKLYPKMLAGSGVVTGGITGAMGRLLAEKDKIK